MNFKDHTLIAKRLRKETHFTPMISAQIHDGYVSSACKHKITAGLLIISYLSFKIFESKKTYSFFTLNALKFKIQVLLLLHLTNRHYPLPHHPENHPILLSPIPCYFVLTL
jgi:hypothetical protein